MKKKKTFTGMEPCSLNVCKPGKLKINIIGLPVPDFVSKAFEEMDKQHKNDKK